MSTPVPDKQFFKIGEVSDIVGVKAHVLRYWESEFPGLRPLKTRGAHRMYRRADLELACLIRRLLYEEGFTIPGAKKRVREIQREAPPAPASEPPPTREMRLRAELIQVRSELQALLDSLDRRARSVAADEAHSVLATVVAVVPKTVLIHKHRL